MKLYGSLTSPFVRAVRIAAIELGRGEEIVFMPTIVKPAEPNRDFGGRVNPIRRVPAIETDDGEIIVDSRVIIEFLNLTSNGEIIPSDASARINALNRHAVTAGAAEGLVAAMYESRIRPEGTRWPAQRDDLVDKAQAALDWSEDKARDFDRAFDIGTIGLVCLIGYGALRFPEVDWLRGRSQVKALYDRAMERRSVFETVPPAQ